MPRRFAILVYAVTAVVFACFFVWPIGMILRGGFEDAGGKFTLAFFKGVFTNPIYLEGFENALALGAASTAIALMIAVPLAVLACRYEFPLRKILMGAVLAPLVLPPFVGAIGVKQMLGHYGVFNSLLAEAGMGPVDWFGGAGRFWAMALMCALGLYPVIYLNALAAVSNIDPAMEEAAENLGCRGFSQFIQITLPLMRPGLFAGGTIAFIWGFTELGVPLIFDYDRITSVQIFSGLQELGQNPFPCALVSVMILCTGVIYALGKGFFGRAGGSSATKAGHPAEPVRPGKFGQAVCFTFFGGVTLLASLPHLAVAGVAFSSDWYQTVLPTGWTLHNFDLALGHPMVVPAIENSLRYAGLASLLNMALGLAIAWVLARSNIPGKWALDAMAMLPLAVPGLVLAFGYVVMSLPGRTFAFLNPTDNPTMLLVIAYALRKLPLMVRSVAAGLEQTSVDYEEAAQNLGSPPLRAALRVTMPLIFASLLAGAILVFSQSMLEVSDSMLLAQKQEFFPVTKAIYMLMGVLGVGPFLASALGTWAMVFLAVTIGGASILMGKKLGAAFRV